MESLEALHKKRWIQLSIIDSDEKRAKKTFKEFLKKENREKLPNFHSNLTPLNEKISYNFFCETTYYDFKTKIEPFLRQKIIELGIENTEIKIDEFAWISYPGLKDALEKRLLPKLGNIILDLVNSSEDSWSPEKAVESITIAQFSLIACTEMQDQELKDFYTWFFNERIEAIETVEGRDIYLDALKDELTKNYNDQKDILCDFFDGVYSAIKNKQDFEHDWINDWIQTCSKVFNDVKNENQPVIVNFDFKPNKNSSYSIDQQKKWTIYSFFLDYMFIHFKVDFIYQLHLTNALKNYFTTKS